MTTNMAAPVDRQRLGRRGPLAAEPSTISWPWQPAELQSKAALKSSNQLHQSTIPQTHTHETLPPGLVAEQRGKNDSTAEKWEVKAEGFLTLPFSPFSSGPGSSQEARTRAITGRPAHASIQRRVTSSIFIFTVTVLIFPYKFEFSLVCRYCNEIINLSSLPQICTKEHYLSQVVDKF